MQPWVTVRGGSAVLEPMQRAVEVVARGVQVHIPVDVLVVVKERVDDGVGQL